MYGGYEFAGIEYAGADIDSNGNLDEFELVDNVIDGVCMIACTGSNI